MYLVFRKHFKIVLTILLLLVKYTFPYMDHCFYTGVALENQLLFWILLIISFNLFIFKLLPWTSFQEKLQMDYRYYNLRDVFLNRGRSIGKINTGKSVDAKCITVHLRHFSYSQVSFDLGDQDSTLNDINMILKLLSCF